MRGLASRRPVTLGLGWSVTACGSGLPFLLLILLGAMLPPWDFDVREYHLQVPKEWYQAGRIGFLPHNVYGNMPLGAEMHALLGMVWMPGERNWWWGALAGKTVIAGFAPLTALGLLAAGRRFVTPGAGVVAALVYLSVPWVVHISQAGLIEGAVACYLFLAVYGIAIWCCENGRRREEPTAQTPRTRCRFGGCQRCRRCTAALGVRGFCSPVSWPARRRPASTLRCCWSLHR